MHIGENHSNGCAAKVLRLSQSAASVLRTSDFYENSIVIDSSITRSLLISDKIIEYDSPFFPDTRHTKIIRGRMVWCCECAANVVYECSSAANVLRTVFLQNLLQSVTQVR